MNLRQLTTEQQAIVNHTHGPALVFAVAGSGKTTAMVHRIERLVREKIFAPEKILATSFSKATVNDLKEQLKTWPCCSGVNPKTLHSIGLEIITKANKLGTPLFSDSGGTQDSPDSVQRQALTGAKTLAIQLNVEWKKELDAFNNDDFLNWVSACKGNLQYSDLQESNLPALALRVASQAVAPTGMTWYLDLYRLYEQSRNKINGITYDDMLMSGWELLHRNPSLLQEMRAAYQCVLVDEFQDVNLAQSEILDLLTGGGDKQREYMAIGDDDQTIYEWRGASPQFILNFKRRYGAKKYIISDNFRCKASQVFLANAIICHNTRREPKHLHLTQGFSGETILSGHASPSEMASKMVDDIKLHLNNGKELRQIAVLIRTYGQTPYLEQALISNKIPYRIEGSSPFYKRIEISVLLSYLAIGDLENRSGAGSLSAEENVELGKRILRIWNVPKRYLRTELCRMVLKSAQGCRGAIGTVLQEMALTDLDINDKQREKLEKLGDLLSWLRRHSTLDESASSVLAELLKRIGYNEHLQKSNAIPEAAQAQIDNVESLVQYSRDKGNVIEFLAHIRELAEASGDTLHNEDSRHVLTIRTIYRAKGLEWPIVLVPHCNEGFIPHSKGDIEEERRLMYVAVTRSKEQLNLYKLNDENVSRFLVESEAGKLLTRVEHITSFVNTDPVKWDALQTLEMVKATHDFNLFRYFSIWATHPDYQHFSKDFVFMMATKLVRIGRFLLGRKTHDTAKSLAITGSHIEPWEEISPFDGDMPQIEDFVGLQQIINQTAQTATNPKTNTKHRTSSEPFERNARVKHPVFGEGSVLEVVLDSGTRIIKIKFDDGTIRRLMLDYALKNGMIPL